MNNLDSGERISALIVSRNPKPDIVVAVIWIVPVPVSHPAIPWIVGPRTTAKHPTQPVCPIFYKKISASPKFIPRANCFWMQH